MSHQAAESIALEDRLEARYWEGSEKEKTLTDNMRFLAYASRSMVLPFTETGMH